jgi:hypothetical protein
VTLGPNEAQTVKIQLVRSGTLEPGEYRSHLYFRAVPKAKPLGEEEEALPDQSSISVKLIPVFGITIPAIIRVGQPEVTVTLSDLALTFAGDTMPRLKMTFNRSGNFSVYGDLVVDHVSDQGKRTRVGMANGFAVYTPNVRRDFELSLAVLTDIDYRTGRLVLTYSAPSDVKPEKYAEAELLLNR